MTNAQPGWYDDGAGATRWWDGSAWTDRVQDGQPAGAQGIVGRLRAEADAGSVPRTGAAGMDYVVLQVVLKEKLLGKGSNNLTQLEDAINAQARLGYRLHTITTTTSGSTGFGGGDRIQATMVFERLT